MLTIVKIGWICQLAGLSALASQAAGVPILAALYSMSWWTVWAQFILIFAVIVSFSLGVSYLLMFRCFVARNRFNFSEFFQKFSFQLSSCFVVLYGFSTESAFLLA